MKMESSQLMEGVKRLEAEEGAVFMHPFDDLDLISGHASLGLEVIGEDEAPDADVVVVCCGGGGLLAGVAAAIKTSSRPGCRVIGVEPETANSMGASIREGAAVQMPGAISVAGGLAPPFAGRNAYKHVR